MSKCNKRRITEENICSANWIKIERKNTDKVNSVENCIIK